MEYETATLASGNSRNGSAMKGLRRAIEHRWRLAQLAEFERGLSTQRCDHAKRFYTKALEAVAEGDVRQAGKLIRDCEHAASV